jgi:hypothetical protein
MVGMTARVEVLEEEETFEKKKEKGKGRKNVTGIEKVAWSPRQPVP